MSATLAGSAPLKPCALRLRSHVGVTFGKTRCDDIPRGWSQYPRATAIRAATMLASWCGCKAFDFVVLAADAIEQLAAVGHPTKVSRSKWPPGNAVAGAGRHVQGTERRSKIDPASSATDPVGSSVTRHVAGNRILS